MIKVSSIVKEIIDESIEATVILEKGCLNLSAYAQQIQPEVEKRAKKPVTTSSIVVALSRLAKTQSEQLPMFPKPSAIEMSARSGLMEIVFERTRENIKLLQTLQKELNATTNEFFMTSQGIAEITFIVSEDQYSRIQKVFKDVTPKATIRHLSGLTLHTTEKDIYIPNVFFSILYPFAVKRFNILELISTYTEITMIFENKDLQNAFEILKQFLQPHAEENV